MENSIQTGLGKTRKIRKNVFIDNSDKQLACKIKEERRLGSIPNKYLLKSDVLDLEFHRTVLGKYANVIHARIDGRSKWWSAQEAIPIAGNLGLTDVFSDC
jgi:hypothetical protein